MPRLARPRNRSAFTLVELLVVIAIIGVLVALLLPAVQSAREAARRMQCGNQLRQVGLAVVTYYEVNKALPGSISYVDEGPEAGQYVANGRGWIVSILPQLEQQPLYDQFDLSAPFGGASGLRARVNLPLVQTKLSVLACPSDATALELTEQQWQWKGTPIAVTSYKGVMGDSMMGQATAFPDATPYCNSGTYECSGLFWRTSMQWPHRDTDMLDGWSNTMVAGEDSTEHNWHAAWSFSNGDTSSTYAPLNFLPNPPAPETWWEMRGFRSLHPGGAYFVFGDDSVRFLSESIDIKTYRALSTRNLGEVVSIP